MEGRDSFAGSLKACSIWRIFDKRTHELADFVVSAAQHYEIDSRNIVAVGYSNGANIAASMLLLRPEILSAAILISRNGTFGSGNQTRSEIEVPYLDWGRLSRSRSFPRRTPKSLSELLRNRARGCNDSLFSKRART